MSILSRLSSLSLRLALSTKSAKLLIQHDRPFQFLQPRALSSTFASASTHEKAKPTRRINPPRRVNRPVLKSPRDRNALIRMKQSERDAENRAERLRRRPSPSRAKEKLMPARVYTLPDVGLSPAQLAALADVREAKVISCARQLDSSVRDDSTVRSPAVVELVAEELFLNVRFQRQTVALAPEDGEDSQNKSFGEMQRRMPVITVMGHVDHGKTSLLDALRETDVAQHEAGGITQSVAAFRVPIAGLATSVTESSAAEGDTDESRKEAFATFIDTPGHAAFSAMRANGAIATDIIVLVVAADDGVMPQTIEAAKLARAANVPIVVAVNKCDVAGADADRVRFQLLQKLDLNTEQLGGDVLCVDISAYTRDGLPDLLDAIALQAELLDLKTRVDAPARAICLESRVDRALGSVATVVVRGGTLHKGDYIAFHSSRAMRGALYGRVRMLLQSDGSEVQEARPGFAAGIIGLHEPIPPGSEVCTMPNERLARIKSGEILQRNMDAVATIEVANHIISERKHKEKRFEDDARVSGASSPALNELEDKSQSEENTIPKRPCVQIVVKGEVRGSADAVSQCLRRLTDDEVDIRIISIGVGDVNEADIVLGSASNALKGSTDKCLVVAFNVKVKESIRKLARSSNVNILEHRIIYHLEDEVKGLLDDLKADDVEEKVVGKAGVLRVFEDGAIAGCVVNDGLVSLGGMARVMRPLGEVKDEYTVEEVFSGEIETIRQFAKTVRSVKKGFECGICIKGWTSFAPGDEIHTIDTVQK